VSDQEMTAERLRKLLSEHVRQSGGRRNPEHSVIAIYLGLEEWTTLMNQPNGNHRAIHPRRDGGFCFDGVPLHLVDEKQHIRIVSEYVEP
jgi:hypothetical protein